MNTLSKIDKLLEEEKDKLDKLEIPDDMESKLRSALDNTIVKRKSSVHLKAASIIILVFLLSYNMDTLAFYAKKLVGYDSVIYGTLYQLNEMGEGQVINKSYTFSDGLEVVLDGVMLDDNNLIVFYTIKDPDGDVQNKDIHASILGSFSGGFSLGGQGSPSSDGKTMRWVLSTDKAPKTFERKMKLDLDYRHDDESYEKGEISFILDRSQAIGKSVNMKINKKVELGNRSIKIDTMVASPTATVIRGEVQNILEYGIDYIRDTIMKPENIEMELIADGKNIRVMSSGIRSDHKGSTFSVTFDALPTDSKEIELKLTNFSGDYDVNEIFEISKEGKTELNALGEVIEILEVYEENDSTYISFRTDENTQLSRVYLLIDGIRHELQETIHGDLEKVVEGDSSKTLYRRTMKYNGTGNKLELDLQRIRMSKEYNELIYSK